MSNQTKIEQQVMAGVAVVYTARKLTSRFALECYAFMLSFVGAAFFVSLPHVAANLGTVAQGGFVSVGTYLVSAILGTKLIVQLALLVAAGALILMGYDMAAPTEHRSTLAA
jgi:hypothetical protein